MSRHALRALALALSLAGCVSSKGDAEHSPTDLGDTGLEDTALEYSGDLDASEELREATWWSIDGTMVLQDGQPVPSATVLTLGFWDQAVEEICSLSSTPTGLEANDGPADIDGASWWSVSLFLGHDNCNGTAWEDHRAFTLGIGPLDARLYPAMEAHGLSPEDSALHSLYFMAAEDGAPLFLFGVAGTEAMFEAASDDSDDTVLDGTYRLMSLHLLPYTPMDSDV
ncbi:MAG: hypothetical protein JXX28_15550 [Deltaproteobacteria bacterium]|nr:hypothetical protein [Deltaproteobacteria bacterium]